MQRCPSANTRCDTFATHASAYPRRRSSCGVYTGPTRTTPSTGDDVPAGETGAPSSQSQYGRRSTTRSGSLPLSLQFVMTWPR